MEYAVGKPKQTLDHPVLTPGKVIQSEDLEGIPSEILKRIADRPGSKDLTLPGDEGREEE